MTTAFGATLKALRRARPPAPFQHNERGFLSQYALAKRAGIDWHSLARYENGRRLPSLPTLARLAAVLDLSSEELAGLVRAAGEDA